MSDSLWITRDLRMSVVNIARIIRDAFQWVRLDSEVFAKKCYSQTFISDKNAVTTHHEYKISRKKFFFFKFCIPVQMNSNEFRNKCIHGLLLLFFIFFSEIMTIGNIHYMCNSHIYYILYIVYINDRILEYIHECIYEYIQQYIVKCRR